MTLSVVKAYMIPALAIAFSVLVTGGPESKTSSVGHYPNHLTGAFTGGFGEDSCHSCHFDYEVNQPEGKIEITGLPDSLQPGRGYSIKLKVYREGLGKAGFQLSARTARGIQAGNFMPDSSQRIQFTESVPDSLQYVQHTNEGSEPAANDSSQWTIPWQAPGDRADYVIFNLAVNAANGDQSEFGDWIYLHELKVKVNR